MEPGLQVGIVITIVVILYIIYWFLTRRKSSWYVTAENVAGRSVPTIMIGQHYPVWIV